MSTSTDILRGYFTVGHNWFEGTMRGVDSDLAHWQPQGKVHPIGSQYIHVVTGEDFFVNTVIKGGAPLMASTYAGKAGFSEPPPMGNRDDWTSRVKVDLDMARAYAQAVYAATDAYIASASDEELLRPIDLSTFGFGMQSVNFVLGLQILNVHNHCGEISAIKGLHGLKGYPG
jgi:hypothetical protein